MLLKTQDNHYNFLHFSFEDQRNITAEGDPSFPNKPNEKYNNEHQWCASCSGRPYGLFMDLVDWVYMKKMLFQLHWEVPLEYLLQNLDLLHNQNFSLQIF